jgi:hypothetical protein
MHDVSDRRDKVIFKHIILGLQPDCQHGCHIFIITLKVKTNSLWKLLFVLAQERPLPDKMGNFEIIAALPLFW